MTFSTPAKTTAPLKPFNSHRAKPPHREDKGKEKGKEIVKEAPKGQKKCFKCHGYGHFQADYLNRTVPTIRKIEEMD